MYVVHMFVCLFKTPCLYKKSKTNKWVIPCLNKKSETSKWVQQSLGIQCYYLQINCITISKSKHLDMKIFKCYLQMHPNYQNLGESNKRNIRLPC